jgi:hypothetical protein
MGRLRFLGTFLLGVLFFAAFARIYTASPAFAAPPQRQNKEIKVWVNTNSGVYHCPGTRWYGNTKRGKYEGECEAINSGNRPAYGKACGSVCQSGLTSGPASSPSPEEKPSPTTKPAGNPDAKVWVNTNSRVYHCRGARWYGRTKHGEFMTEKKAQDAGYRPAYGKACP